MNTLLKAILRRVIRRGSLEIQSADGSIARYGDGTGPDVAIRFADKAAERLAVLDPQLQIGELYMQGRLDVTRGTLLEFIGIGSRNMVPGAQTAWMAAEAKVRVWLRRLAQHNTRLRSRENVARHYDLDGRLYRLFLDPDMQYSCAYFENENATLEEAQLAKKRHIVAKLLIEKHHKVLDIGCGFGGMALYIAQHTGAHATGVTLSKEQFGTARSRAEERGLSDRTDFRMQDYRDVPGPFDRIVSVGMFEHVGVGYYDEYFSRVAQLLTKDGVALIHSIGRPEGPGATNPWIAKYIFPGGYIPALSEVLPAVERAGLFVTDVEILRLHYAETLKAWNERFQARREEARSLYDERFCRMWEFYLAGSESAFRDDGMMVFQIQLARRHDKLPLTRDYIGQEEARLRQREAATPHLRLAGE